MFAPQQQNIKTPQIPTPIPWALFRLLRNATPAAKTALPRMRAPVPSNTSVSLNRRAFCEASSAAGPFADLHRRMFYRIEPRHMLPNETEGCSTVFHRRIFHRIPLQNFLHRLPPQDVQYRRIFHRIPSQIFLRRLSPQDLPPYSTAEIYTPSSTAGCSTVFHRRIFNRIPPQDLLSVGGGVSKKPFPVELSARFAPRRGERPS